MKVVIDVEIFNEEVTVVTKFDELKVMYSEADFNRPFITVECDQGILVYVSDQFNGMRDGPFMQCLTHELNHAAMCVLGRNGINFDYQNQEILCYTQDFLMRKVIDEINKEYDDIRKKPKNKCQKVGKSGI